MKKTCAPALGRTRSIEPKPDFPAFADRAALLVEPDRQERRDDQEPGERGEEDVVAPEPDERPDERDRQHEHADAVGDAGGGTGPEVAPARGKPAQPFQERKVALEPRVAGLADAGGLAEQPVGLVGLAHVLLLQQADLAAR